MAAFPDSVDDCPVPFSLLQMIDRQFRNLVPPEAARHLRLSYFLAIRGFGPR